MEYLSAINVSLNVQYVKAQAAIAFLVNGVIEIQFQHVNVKRDSLKMLKMNVQNATIHVVSAMEMKKYVVNVRIPKEITAYKVAHVLPDLLMLNNKNVNNVKFNVRLAKIQ